MYVYICCVRDIYIYMYIIYIYYNPWAIHFLVATFPVKRLLALLWPEVRIQTAPFWPMAPLGLGSVATQGLKNGMSP